MNTTDTVDISLVLLGNIEQEILKTKFLQDKLAKQEANLKRARQAFTQYDRDPKAVQKLCNKYLSGFYSLERFIFELDYLETRGIN